MYMQKLVKEAKEFAGIKPDTIIDEEEKYYNRGAVEKYEAFLAGANCAYNEFINKACEWLKFHVSVPYEGETTENGNTPAKEYLNWAKKRLEAAEKICNDFRKAMEE